MGWFNKSRSEWKREAGELAIRITADEVLRRGLNRPFHVYDGTEAIVFSQGRLIGRLPAGTHDIDGPLRKWIVGDGPTVLILIDAGELTLDSTLGGLYSRENIDLSAKIRVKLQLANPELFYTNTIKGQSKFLLGDLQSMLDPEIRDALLSYTSARSIDDLHRFENQRRECESILRDRLGQSLQRSGFQIVSVSLVEFSSPQFDKVRSGTARVEIDSRQADVLEARVEVLRRVRENLASNIEHRQVTETELRDAINQSVHELGIKDRLRDDELHQLTTRLEQDASDYLLQRTQQRESDTVGHQLEIDATQQAHGRQQKSLDIEAYLAQRIAEAETTEKVRDADRSGDEKDWELAERIRNSTLDARKRRKMDDVDVEKARIDALSRADLATKLAALGDTEALAELARLEKQSQLSDDQLLVVAAEKSPAVAAALAKRFESEGRMSDDMMDQLRRQLDQERQANREHASQLERVLKQALDKMGDVASARAKSAGPGDQTIVTGGLGTPTIINPNRSDPPAEQQNEQKST